MKTKAYFLIIGVLLNITILSAQAVEVILKEEVVVASSDVFLSDIAEIYGGLSDASHELKKLYIGRSPLLGRSKEYKKDYIKMRLASQGGIQLKGAEKVSITTDYQVLDLGELKNKVKEYLMGCISDAQEEIEIEFYRVPEKIILPKGEVELFVGFKKRPTRLTGNIYVPVRIDISGKKYKVVEIGVKIRKFSRVVVVSKDLTRNHILDKSDVTLALMETTFLSCDVVKDIDLVLNKRLTDNLRKDMPLCERWVKIPPLVKRGQEVDILVQMKNVQIKTKGLAREDGIKGELIKVRNISSKKIVQARVAGREVVIVE